MSGWTTNLVGGLAQLLEDAGVGVYRPTGAYADGETGIYDRYIPPTGRCITLSAYPTTPGTPGLADVSVGVQVRVRGDGDPVSCDDLADAVFEVLDGAGQRDGGPQLDLGGVKVVQIWRQSYTPLGPDANGQWERSENFYVDAMRPTTFNTD